MDAGTSCWLFWWSGFQGSHSWILFLVPLKLRYCSDFPQPTRAHKESGSQSPAFYPPPSTALASHLFSSEKHLILKLRGNLSCLSELGWRRNVIASTRKATRKRLLTVSSSGDHFDVAGSYCRCEGRPGRCAGACAAAAGSQSASVCLLPSSLLAHTSVYVWLFRLKWITITNGYFDN